MFLLRDAAPRTDSEPVAGSLARLAVSPDGVILECSTAAARAFGFEADALRGEHVSQLFPELGGTALLSGGRVNPRIAYLLHCGMSLQGRCADGRRVAVEPTLFALRDGAALRVLLAWEIPPEGGRAR
ncbi:MAG: PAS domain-containing protein [Burkholderiales bacterium]|nr:PAS domain-containing protein [Burkholderiales bacterium]